MFTKNNKKSSERELKQELEEKEKCLNKKMENIGKEKILLKKQKEDLRWR